VTHVDLQYGASTHVDLVREADEDAHLVAADAAGHPDRHIVTRNLGGPVRHEPDLFIRPAEVSGRMQLCSDGVSEMLAHEDIARILDEDPAPAASAETAVVVDVVGLTREMPHDTVVQQPSTEQETHP